MLVPCFSRVRSLLVPCSFHARLLLLRAAPRGRVHGALPSLLRVLHPHTLTPSHLLHPAPPDPNPHPPTIVSPPSRSATRPRASLALCLPAAVAPWQPHMPHMADMPHVSVVFFCALVSGALGEQGQAGRDAEHVHQLGHQPQQRGQYLAPTFAYLRAARPASCTIPSGPSKLRTRLHLVYTERSLPSWGTQLRTRGDPHLGVFTVAVIARGPRVLLSGAAAKPDGPQRSRPPLHARDPESIPPLGRGGRLCGERHGHRQGQACDQRRKRVRRWVPAVKAGRAGARARARARERRGRCCACVCPSFRQWRRQRSAACARVLVRLCRV